MAELANAYNNVVITRTGRSTVRVFALAVLAGAFIAFAAAANILGTTYGNKFIAAAIFPLGLIMVILVGAELFTGNSLLLISLVHKKINWVALFKNWIIVYAGNLLGSLLIVLLVYWSGVFAGEQICGTLQTVAANKTSHDFLQLFGRGVLCNILVCIAVWMAFGAKGAGHKILAIFGPIFIFVLSGFEHSIANMFYLPMAILQTGCIDWFSFFVVNLVPVTLGNMVGGAAFALVIAFVSKKV